MGPDNNIAFRGGIPDRTVSQVAHQPSSLAYMVDHVDLGMAQLAFMYRCRVQQQQVCSSTPQQDLLAQDQQDLLHRLPDDVLVDVLRRVPPASLANVACVSRRMHAVLGAKTGNSCKDLRSMASMGNDVWRASLLASHAVLSKREMKAVGYHEAARLDDAWRRHSPTGRASLATKTRLAASPDAEGALLCGGISVKVIDGAARGSVRVVAAISESRIVGRLPGKSRVRIVSAEAVVPSSRDHTSPPAFETIRDVSLPTPVRTNVRGPFGDRAVQLTHDASTLANTILTSNGKLHVRVHSVTTPTQSPLWDATIEDPRAGGAPAVPYSLAHASYGLAALGLSGRRVAVATPRGVAVVDADASGTGAAATIFDGRANARERAAALPAFTATCAAVGEYDSAFGCISVAAGSSRGFVDLLDADAEKVVGTFIGSCSCAVSCLSLGVAATDSAPTPLSSCVFGGFAHRETNARGNGHAPAVFVWDVRSGDRVAMLPCPRRGRSAGAVEAVHHEGSRVLAAAEGQLVAFDCRTWKPCCKPRHIVENAAGPICIDLTFSARALAVATHEMLAPEHGANAYGGPHESFDLHVAPII